MIDTWEPEPYDQRKGATLDPYARDQDLQRRDGGAEAAELLMAGAQEGSAAYVGFERIGLEPDGSHTFALDYELE